jgi:biotin-(acetyl-CoA carboxylase) ligase
MRQDFPRTSLRDDGCVDLTVAELLEAFSRHFLTWINRWQDDGFEPVRAMWLCHAPDHGETIEIEVEGKQVSGVFEGIDDDGALVLGQGEATRRVALDTALARPPG